MPTLTDYVPRTELDAVNDVISVIGEDPVNTLEGDDDNADVIAARRILGRLNAQIQDRGWTFNVDDSYELVPDAFSNKIVWMPSWLRLTTPGGATPYINQNGFVYDRIGRTDQFTGRVTVTMQEIKPFTELPLCFRLYICARAKKQFNKERYGDPGIDAGCDEEIAQASLNMMEYELDYGGFNMFNDDPFFQSVNGRS